MLFQVLMGFFMFYKKVSNLFAVQILRLVKYSLAQFYNKNKVAMSNYLRMVSDNRIKLIIFNILVCFCIGGMLSAYILTINSNILGCINTPKDIENNQSFIPLFLKNRIKSIKFSDIGAFCFFSFVVVVNCFSENLMFIILIYLILLLLGFIICYTLYIYIKLYILKHGAEIKEFKLIKKYSFLYTVFIKKFELQSSNDEIKKFFINHYHGLIIFYLSCIIVLLFSTALWAYLYINI